MQNEQWRAEFHEYALLLEAVASGDRTRVARVIANYLLDKAENQETTQTLQDYQEPEQDHDQTFQPVEDFADNYQDDDTDYQPRAIAKTPAAASSSFLGSRATLKPVKILVHGGLVSLRSPKWSSAMQNSLGKAKCRHAAGRR